MSSNPPILNTAELISEAVLEAYTAEGYITSSGDLDQQALAEALYDLTTHQIVSALDERANKATRREQVRLTAFPNLGAHGYWLAEDFTDDRLVAAKAWDTIHQKVWDMVGSNAGKPVQSMVLSRLPGHMLCRTTLGTNIAAVYVTDSFDCMVTDGPEAERLGYERAATRLSKAYGVVGKARPDKGAELRKLHARDERRALTTGRATLDRLLPTPTEEPVEEATTQ